MWDERAFFNDPGRKGGLAGSHFLTDCSLPVRASMKRTIAAIATPPGEGAIGIVRLSGPGVPSIISRLFRGRGVPTLTPWRMTLGRVRDPSTAEDIDEVLAVFMPGPRSYTGEDMAEFQTHGGRLILERVLSACIRAGAGPGEPGEFTRRAFLNGRLDLAQAEAVIDLICSRSDGARRAALRQLDGGLSQVLAAVRDDVAGLAARIEAELDFSEEEDLGEGITPASLDSATGAVENLLSRMGESRVERDGVRVTFAGRKNVGKSSLINVLLGEERSIVTAHPGTTRDTVESRLLVEGTALLLIDTAGLGPSSDPVEMEGIRRSREKLRSADLAVIVVDSSQALDAVDRRLLEETLGRPSLVVLSKTDLPSLVGEGEVTDLAGGRVLVRTSARRAAGMKDLHRALGASVAVLPVDEQGKEPSLLTSARHAEALERTLSALGRAKEALGRGSTLDVVATDMREALAALGEITGETVTEELLDRIFNQFCIGK